MPLFFLLCLRADVLYRSDLPPRVPLLLANTASTTRDHLANERTFLSWLRLSIYMAIVSIAIIISFHLKNQPSAIEKKVALPFGLIFWVLSLACLSSGAANYVRTSRGYAEGRALVQSGWKTQVVSRYKWVDLNKADWNLHRSLRLLQRRSSRLAYF